MVKNTFLWSTVFIYAQILHFFFATKNSWSFFIPFHKKFFAQPCSITELLVIKQPKNA